MKTAEILLIIAGLIILMTALKCYSNYAELRFKNASKIHICRYNDIPGCEGTCCGYCEKKTKCRYICHGDCDKCVAHRIEYLRR